MTESEKFRAICWHCYRPKSVCLCSAICPFMTQTRFIFLMHPKEYKKEKNGTGRLAHLFLPNSKIIMGVDFSQNEELKRDLASTEYETFLLYPGPHARLVTTENSDTLQMEMTDRPWQIIVIDGTWPCAKKMMRVNPFLHSIPRITFPISTPSKFVIKQQPHHLCLSTIEAVSSLLSILMVQKRESPDLPLLRLNDVLDQLVQQQIDFSLNPPNGSYRQSTYRHPVDRIPAKKWEKKNIFFMGN